MRRDLRPLLAPRSIAVVGASPRLNRASGVLRNLQTHQFAGRLYPINPKYDEIAGLPCYADLGATPEPADCAVIAVAKEQVLGIVEDAARAGVRAVIILSSGFAESDAAGRERQIALEEIVSRNGMLCCGPNCFGIVNFAMGAVAYSGELQQPLRPGNIALVSQSGGFAGTIADQLISQRRGAFSYVVSCGNQVGVSLEDYIAYLAEDPDTRVIGVFAEGFKHPQKLGDAVALARTNGKPVVVFRTGRSENARQAALTHTGVLAGPNKVVDAALRQFGIVQASGLGEMIESLALFSRASTFGGGQRVVVLTGFGGQCGYFADAADRAGVLLPPLSVATRSALADILPDFASPRNPLDGTGAMYEDRSLFPKLLGVLIRDPEIDILAVHLNAEPLRPSGRSPSRTFVEQLVASLAEPVTGGRRPVICCFSSVAGGPRDEAVLSRLAEAGIPFLDGTERAVQAIGGMVDFSRGPNRAAPRAAVARHGAASRPPGAIMNSENARRLLASRGVPVLEAALSRSASDAAAIAERLGYPVVLKVESPDIQHKTDVGGVRLGCSDAEQVRAAYSSILEQVSQHVPHARIDGVTVQRSVSGVEMIVGAHLDPQYGPVVLVGLGGIFVEVLAEYAMRLAPVSETQAREMISELTGAALLEGARGKPRCDIAALSSTIVAVSRLAAEHRETIGGIDINPLIVLAEGQGAIAVDWLVVLKAEEALRTARASGLDRAGSHLVPSDAGRIAI